MQAVYAKYLVIKAILLKRMIPLTAAHSLLQTLELPNQNIPYA